MLGASLAEVGIQALVTRMRPGRCTLRCTEVTVPESLNLATAFPGQPLPRTCHERDYLGHPVWDDEGNKHERPRGLRERE